jgi:hypothetical protein
MSSPLLDAAKAANDDELRASIQAQRNNARRARWERKWALEFGDIPSLEPSIFNFSKASLTEAACISTSVFVPDCPNERHGNSNVVHICSHKKQYDTRRYPDSRWGIGDGPEAA